MSTINDYKANKTRRSHNLRGLYDHARRIARRDGRPLCTTVDRVEVRQLYVQGQFKYAVEVYYRGGDVGAATFLDRSIALRWSDRFAANRGGKLINLMRRAD